MNPEGLSVQEKIDELRKFNMARYEQLVDAVYKRRGWDTKGVVKLDTVKRLGIDFPDVVALIQKSLS